MKYNLELPSNSIEKEVVKEIFKDDGKSKLTSPDFHWIAKNDKTIFVKLFGLNFRRKNDQNIGHQIAPRGLYIYGSVGTGKSMIMGTAHLI